VADSAEVPAKASETLTAYGKPTNLAADANLGGVFQYRNGNQTDVSIQADMLP